MKDTPMTTPTETPTPLTDAAWDSCSTPFEALSKMRDTARQLERQLTAATAQLEEARREVDFYKQSITRVAKAVGVTTPLQLIAMAESNSETYVDLLLKHIAAMTNQKEEK